MNQLIVLISFYYLLLHAAVTGILVNSKRNTYRAGQLNKNKNNQATVGEGRCEQLNYLPFSPFQNLLKSHENEISNEIGTQMIPHYLTTYVANSYNDTSFGGTATLCGGGGKMDNYLSVCSYSKENTIEGKQDNSAINWLAWIGQLSPIQSSRNFHIKIDVDSDGTADQSCATVFITDTELLGTVVVSGGVCGDYISTGDLAVWVNRITYNETFGKKAIEVCAANTLNLGGKQICVYGTVMESRKAIDVSPFGVLEAGSFRTNKLPSCIERKFGKKYEVPPLVFVSPFYHTKSVDWHSPPIAWVEYSNEIGFEACVNHLEGSYAEKEGSKDAPGLRIDYIVVPRSTLDVHPKIDDVGFSIRGHSAMNVEQLVNETTEYLEEKLCSFLLDVSAFYDVQCELDSYFELDGDFTFNILVSGTHKPLGDARVLLLQSRLDSAIRLLFFVRENEWEDTDSLKEKVIESGVLTNPFGFDRLLQIVLRCNQHRVDGKSQEPYASFINSLVDALTDYDLFSIGTHLGYNEKRAMTTKCSVGQCVPGEYGGRMVLVRQYSHGFEHSLHPPLVERISCNQPPCEIENAAYDFFLQ